MPGDCQDGPVTPHIPSLRPPIAFAHRGARAHAPENTLEAFELALRLGATGLESDVWLTSDGVAVLDHDGYVGSRLRRRPMATATLADLPEHVPTLAQLYETCGTDFELSLDVKDPAAAPQVTDVARAAGIDVLARLWLCHHDHDLLVSWREQAPEVKLVHSTRLRRFPTGPERHAAELHRLGIDAMNMHHSDWSGGLTTLFHRFGVLAFGWDAQFERVLDELFDMGIDAVYSDHVDRMVEAAVRWG
jgi:glycerophosphoryl diester phosphodiesterase